MNLYRKKTTQKPLKIYNSKVSIDTIKIKADATKEQIGAIFDLIYTGYHPTSYYEYNLHLKNIGFSLHINPLPEEKRSNFNIAITLQTAFFQADYIPHSIIDILASIDWRIRWLDLAFDYVEPYANSFVYKHHGLVKHRKLSDDNNHTSFNLGSPTKEQRNHRQINYDRNEKEISKGISDGSRHAYSNRFEAKLRFPLFGEKSMPLNDISHDLIINQLKRYIFIVDLEEDMQIDGRTKRIFHGLQKDYDNINRYDTKRKAELKAIAYEHRQPIETVYTSHMDELFNFLTYREHTGTIPASIASEQYRQMLDEQQHLLRL